MNLASALQSENKLVDVRGFEPLPPCLQRRQQKSNKCCIWCRLHKIQRLQPPVELDRSRTESLGVNPLDGTSGRVAARAGHIKRGKKEGSETLWGRNHGNGRKISRYGARRAIFSICHDLRHPGTERFRSEEVAYRQGSLLIVTRPNQEAQLITVE